MFHSEGAEAAQFNAITPRQCLDYLLKDDIHNPLNIALKQMRVGSGDLLDQFGLYHVLKFR